jgi:menaquinone-dependent protoporphyrinogen oxidase
MKVLIATASRHGATTEIAAAIAATLHERGIQTSVSNVEETIDLSTFDAFILGSAVYMGKWLKRPRSFIDAHASELSTRPVWLFSSGPLGTPSKPSADHAVDLGDLLAQTGARDHRLFAGRLDRADLSVGERAITKVIHAPSGDFRDWDSIRGWAGSIADGLLDEASEWGGTPVGT